MGFPSLFFFPFLIPWNKSMKTCKILKADTTIFCMGRCVFRYTLHFFHPVPVKDLVLGAPRQKKNPNHCQCFLPFYHLLTSFLLCPLPPFLLRHLSGSYKVPGPMGATWQKCVHWIVCSLFFPGDRGWPANTKSLERLDFHTMDHTSCGAEKKWKWDKKRKK